MFNELFRTGYVRFFVGLRFFVQLLLIFLQPSNTLKSAFKRNWLRKYFSQLFWPPTYNWHNDLVQLALTLIHKQFSYSPKRFYIFEVVFSLEFLFSIFETVQKKELLRQQHLFIIVSNISRGISSEFQGSSKVCFEMWAV